MAPLNPSLFFFFCVRVCRVTALCLRTCVCPCRWSPALHINPPVRAVGLRFHRDAKSRTLCLLPFIFSSRALWVCQETKFMVEQHTVTPSLPRSLRPAREQPRPLQASRDLFGPVRVRANLEVKGKSVMRVG